MEEGRLKLDDRAFGLLRDLKPRAGSKINPQLDSITLRQLLEHAGGWDRDQSFDPMFRAKAIARAMGVPSPPDARTIVRYMLDQPLQFAPGTRYAYSNFGYCVLGRIIEATTGGAYEEYVETHILRPAGITCMRLGHTLEKDRAPREVRYYDFPGNGMAPSVFPGGPAKRPWPYGGWSIEAMDAHGGWIASAVDMARFINALEGRGPSPPILQPASRRQMTARPGPPLWVGTETWYGMGWQVRTADGGVNWWHMGSLDGTSTLMVRAANGLTWVALFNSRPKDSDAFGSELDSAMWKAVDGVSRWPAHDLFREFGGCP